MAQYAKGQLVRVSGRYQNAAGTNVDPAVAKFDFRAPTSGGSPGPSTTYTFPTDAQLVKDSVGLYHVDLNVTTTGIWYYRFYGTGTNQAANEDSFEVTPSQF